MEHVESKGRILPDLSTLKKPKDGKQRLIVNVPTHEMVPYQFAFDLANMIGYTIAMVGDKLDIVTNVVPGTYIHRARQQLIDQSLEMGCNWMLWCDSDMRFPKDALLRLMQHNEDFVGINYSSRTIPPRYIGIKRIGIDHQEDGLGGALLPTRPDSTGLEECEAMGFGLVLMKAAWLPRLPTDKPWFFFGWDENRAKHVGEDVWFARLAREAGVKLYIDHDLSKECAHCGHMEYRLEHANEFEHETADMIDDFEEETHGDHELQRASDGGGQLDEQERPDESDS